MTLLNDLVSRLWRKYQENKEYKQFKVGLVCYIKLLDEYGLHSEQELNYYAYLVTKNSDYKPWLNRARKMYMEEKKDGL